MTWPRWMITLETRLIRGIISVLQTFLHLSGRKGAAERFVRTIPTSISPGGKIKLHFYTPKNFLQASKQTRFPVVVNFHGGGFCIGTIPEDDAWCNRVVQDLNAVVVSVEYRLAPEHPFPIPVQDGVDAIDYLVANAVELCIDVDRIATSGFSAGGNLSITVPLMFHQLQQERKNAAGSQAVAIKAVVAWYPVTDYTLSREERLALMKFPNKALPRFLTRMFDAGYIPDTTARTSPYMSPSVTPDDQLSSIPQDIIMYTCEWDMLEREATELARRLEKNGHRVRARMVEGVVHGWDKFPRANPSPDLFYVEACLLLRKAFEGEDISSL